MRASLIIHTVCCRCQHFERSLTEAQKSLQSERERAQAQVGAIICCGRALQCVPLLTELMLRVCFAYVALLTEPLTKEMSWGVPSGVP